jgi:regulation of enolase protein 1 (concanavalin A-like superfamily)
MLTLYAPDGSKLNPQFEWYCEPTRWSLDAGKLALQVRTDSYTDFWRRTHSGNEADNGHFLWTSVASDFVMIGRVRSAVQHQYDQAGLMVRVDPENWIKTSVEMEPGDNNRLGAVVTTAGYSDWSTQDVPSDRVEFWFRVRRERETYTVESSQDGYAWTQIRQAHLAGRAVQCGVYACSPNEGGCEAVFDQFLVSCVSSA